jgi:histone H3/H4
MDKEILVEKIRNSLEELEQKEGDFSLVMIVPTDPNSDPYSKNSKYNLIISSSWLDKSKPKNAINIIYNSLKNNLNDEDIINISRINVINSSDNLVSAATSAFNVEHGIANLNNVNIFGIQIPNAIILESRKTIPLNAIMQITKENGTLKIEPKASVLLIKKVEEYIGKLAKSANEHANKAGRKNLTKEDVEMYA